MSAALLGVALAVGTARTGAVTSSVVTNRMVSFEGRSSFDQVKLSPINRPESSQFTRSAAHAYDGRYSGRAHLAANAAADTKYARGIFEVNWDLGTEVWVGASYYLPRGFLKRIQGHVTLLRCDNWDASSHGLTGGAFDRTGFMIFGSDDRARIIYMDDEFRQLTTSVSVPEGRWFSVAMHFRFSATNPENELWIDGRRVATSNEPNYDYSHFFHLDRVRYGLVESWDAVQTKGLTLWVDRAWIAPTRLAPLKRR